MTVLPPGRPHAASRRRARASYAERDTQEEDEGAGAGPSGRRAVAAIHRAAAGGRAARGATVGDLYTRLGETDPGLAPALDSALPVVAGEHVPRDRTLHDRQEVALLLPPVSGG